MLNPSDIFADIESYPPLRRQEIGDTYVGKEVNWAVVFANGSVRQGEADLIFRSDPEDMRMVTGTVSLAAHPWLKSLGTGERVQLRGRIRRLDRLIINLDILDLRLPEPAPLSQER